MFFAGSLSHLKFLSQFSSISSIHWCTLRSTSSNDYVPIQIYVQTLEAGSIATRKQDKPSYCVNLALPLAANIAELDNNLRMTLRPIGGIRILSAKVMDIDGLIKSYCTPCGEKVGKLRVSGFLFWETYPWVTGGNKV